MDTPARRTLLSLPLLALPAVAQAAYPIPRFTHWIGRTALLRGDGAAARLLLRPDGTGLMAVRLFVFCRILPVLNWTTQLDGALLRYRRISALDSARLITGEAHIAEDAEEIVWIEATVHRAAFEGFAEPEAAGRCS